MAAFLNFDENNNIDSRSPKTLVLENVNVLSDISNSQFPALTRERLQSLKMKDCIINDNVFVSILSQLSSIEVMEFKNVYVRKGTPPSSDTVRKIICCHTRQISIEGGDLEILNIILAPNLKEFRFAVEQIRPYEQLIFFLCQHSTISALEIHASYSDIMDFFEFVPNYGFSLTNLSLVSTNFDEQPSTLYEENFLKFLKCHITSLKALDIKANVSLNVLDFMLKHFRLLKTVELKVSKLPQNPQFYTIKRPRKSIKELVLSGPFSNINTIISIIMLYPAIQHLSICDYNYEFSNDLISGEILSDVLLHVTEMCKELKHLRMVRMPILKRSLKFAKLRTLQVAYINNVHDIIKFIAENQTIDSLIIDFVFRHQANASFLIALVQSGIKRLSIFAEPVEIQSIHDFFALYKGFIEILELKCEVDSRIKTYEFKFSQETSNAMVSTLLASDVSYSIIQEVVHHLDEL